jgi:multidrug efflux system outer membrane protein
MRRAGISLAVLAALSGCNLEPRFARPQLAVPPSWPAGDAYLRQSEAALPSLSWRDIFTDPKLQAVIAQALENNQDLRIALANIEVARAQFSVQRADILPDVVASGNATQRQNPSSGQNVVNAGGQRTRTTYQLQGGINAFEIDLWGRLRSLTNAAFDQYLGQAAAARAARLTLVAAVANAYLQLASDRSLLAIALDTEKNAGEGFNLTKARLDGGVAPRTELRQAETILATARGDKAALTARIAQDRNALELLVGGPVSNDLLPGSIEAVDELVAQAPAGIDSTILLRRPDVVQAEYQLRGTNARIGAARAAFLPRISLTALGGFTSLGLSSLFTNAAETWTLAPSGSVTLFDGGALSGNLKLAKAQREVAVATYQRTIQTAFREVADALARAGTIEDEIAANRLNVAAADDSYTLGMARYREGVDPYLLTLDAQRTLYSARRTLAVARLTRAQNRVAVYQTLGGDQLLADLPGTTAARDALDTRGK